MLFRWLNLCVAAALITACTAASDADDRPVVLTTFTVIQDIAQNVAGDHLRVESLTGPGTEIHGYEPTPGDLRRAAGADLILYNGLGLEAWFDQFVQRVDAPRIELAEGIETIPIADDAYAGLPNPHAWMSPTLAAAYVDVIAEAFADLAPEHADDFRANAAAYQAELTRVREDLAEALATIPPAQRALVTCEGAFSYLARDAGLTEQYIWPVNAEAEATPQRVAATVRFVEQNDVPAVFCESTVDDGAMQRVVNSTDAEFGGVLYVDSLTGPDGDAPTYLALIEHAARTIADGLAGDDR